MANIKAFIAELNELSREYGIAIKGDYNGHYLFETETRERIADGPNWTGKQYEWYGDTVNADSPKVKPVEKE